MKSTVSSSHAEAFVKAGRVFTNAMSTVLTVSYTHLDVYKRQLVNSSYLI